MKEAYISGMDYVWGYNDREYYRELHYSRSIQSKILNYYHCFFPMYKCARTSSVSKILIMLFFANKEWSNLKVRGPFDRGIGCLGLASLDIRPTVSQVSRDSETRRGILLMKQVYRCVLNLSGARQTKLKSIIGRMIWRRDNSYARVQTTLTVLP